MAQSCFLGAELESPTPPFPHLVTFTPIKDDLNLEVELRLGFSWFCVKCDLLSFPGELLFLFLLSQSASGQCACVPACLYGAD